MKTIKIDVDITNLLIVPKGKYLMNAEIEIDEEDIEKILKEIDIYSIVKHYGVDALEETIEYLKL